MGKDLRQCAFVALCVCLTNSVCCETISQSAGFSKASVSNITIKNHLLRSLQRVRSASRCLANCLREPDCVAVSYSKQSGKCELYDGSETDFPLDVITDTRWSYYEITSKTTQVQTTDMPSTKAPMTTKQPTTQLPTTEKPSTTALQTTEQPSTTEELTTRQTTASTTELPTTELKTTAQPGHRDCWGYYSDGHRTSGIYTIHVKGATPGGTDVYCDMQFGGGGWTTIQRRVFGTVNFYRDWSSYKMGFGIIDDNDSDFWLGLDLIYLLTNQDDYQLRIPLVDWYSNVKYARYSAFRVSSEADNYRLTVSGFTGTGGDSLIATHNGMPWTTYDRDNDNNGEANCAIVYQGAWWYRDCLTSNLNGPRTSTSISPGHGMVWNTWPGELVSLMEVEMKIKPLSAG